MRTGRNATQQLSEYGYTREYELWTEDEYQ